MDFEGSGTPGGWAVAGLPPVQGGPCGPLGASWFEAMSSWPVPAVLSQGNPAAAVPTSAPRSQDDLGGLRVRGSRCCSLRQGESGLSRRLRRVDL